MGCVPSKNHAAPASSRSSEQECSGSSQTPEAETSCIPEPPAFPFVVPLGGSADTLLNAIVQLLATDPIPTLVVLAPNMTNVVYLNPAWSRVHDQHLDELYGAPLSSLLKQPLTSTELKQALERVQENGATDTIALGTTAHAVPMKIGKLKHLFPKRHHQVQSDTVVGMIQMQSPMGSAAEQSTDDRLPALEETLAATAEEANACELLRHRFQAQIVDSRKLLRFVRASDGDAQDACQRVQATLDWRAKNSPQEWKCQWCLDQPGHHSLRQVGFDKLNRPIIYATFSQAAAECYNIDDTVQHWVYVMESAMRSSQSASIVFINDFSGFSVKAMKLSLASGVHDLLSSHYPEQLGLFIGINAPTVFGFFWRSMRSLLQPSTVAKVHFADYGKEMDDILKPICDAETWLWLCEEVRLNTDADHLPLAQDCNHFWQVPAPQAQHDPRGSPFYVEHFLSTPVDTDDSTCHWPHPNIITSVANRTRVPEPTLIEKPDEQSQSVLDRQI